MTRESIAYGLIALAIFATVSWTAFALPRWRRRKLRRQGIKTFGH